MDENWNVFQHSHSEPSPVVSHQYWTLGLGQRLSDLPVDQEQDSLIRLTKGAIRENDLATKLGRSEEDLLGLIREAALGNKTVYISMTK